MTPYNTQIQGGGWGQVYRVCGVCGGGVNGVSWGGGGGGGLALN